MIRRLLLIVVVGSLVALAVLNFDPVTTKLHRLAILCAIAGLWFGPLALLWKKKVLRLTLLILPILFLVPFSLPAKAVDKKELRNSYTRNLISYQGTRYHWGGESGRGIDCSGLPRKAMREALFSNGLQHLNGASLRLFLKHWWNDASAKALAEGHLDFTIPTGESGTIATMDYSKIEPGDLVVTEDRRHILVFLGGEKWIQADPGAGKVVILNGRTSPNGWFAVPVTSHRWSLLAERSL